MTLALGGGRNEREQGLRLARTVLAGSAARTRRQRTGRPGPLIPAELSCASPPPEGHGVRLRLNISCGNGLQPLQLRPVAEAFLAELARAAE